MSVMQTIQGDQWDLVSFRAYGDEAHIGKLIQANPNHQYTSVFSAGVTLVLPEIAQGESRILPPWKRSST